MTTAQAQTGNTGKYVVVYLCILAIAGLQFVIAYSNIDGSQMFTRMMLLACVEAVLAVLFFMHLWIDRRGLLWFVAVFTIFVLLAMQYGWTDSYRLLDGVPWAK
jgi:cytochrome c oxidase subunit IV